MKECHGDLHLTNTMVLDSKLVAFDCLEFSRALRLIDVCCDVAFFVMDMDLRNQSGLGAAFLSSYLETSGDYEMLPLLRYFLVYRTMVSKRKQSWDCFVVSSFLGNKVRAKIHCIGKNWDRVKRHVALALRYTQVQPPVFVLMAGVSGSGKVKQNFGSFSISEGVFQNRVL